MFPKFEIAQYRICDDGEQHSELDTNITTLLADLLRNWSITLRQHCRLHIMIGAKVRLTHNTMSVPYR